MPPTCAIWDEIFINDPPRPAAINPVATAWVRKYAPFTFKSETASKSGSFVSTAGEWRARPAEFNKTSKGPKSETNCWVSEMLTTSITCACALWPATCNSATS